MGPVDPKEENPGKNTGYQANWELVIGINPVLIRYNYRFADIMFIYFLFSF